MTRDDTLGLAEGLRLSGLTHQQLWVRYFALGGSGTLDDLHHHLANAQNCPDTHEHNIIAQALNDVFLEAGVDHPVGYRHLYRHPRHREGS